MCFGFPTTKRHNNQPKISKQVGNTNDSPHEALSNILEIREVSLLFMVPSSSSSSVLMTIVPSWDSRVPSCSIMVLAPSLMVFTALIVPVSSPLALTMVPESVSSSSCSNMAQTEILLMLVKCHEECLYLRTLPSHSNSEVFTDTQKRCLVYALCSLSVISKQAMKTNEYFSASMISKRTDK